MAADVGVKVSMEGEKQFRDSLKDIAQEGKTLKSEMDKVSSSFDDNTSAMDKYKAQSKVLTDQIDNQKERVQLLTTQYEKYAEQLGDDDRKTQAMKEQVNKATTELNKMETQLKNLGSPLQALGDDMKATGDKISAAGDKISGVGKGITAGVTAPIAAVGTASMAAWKEYDEAADNIIKMTGASGDALEGLTDVMDNLATSIPVSFEQASAAVGEINTRFGSTGEELEEISGAFLKFAELNGISDIAGTVNTVQASMAAWKIETEDTSKVLDTLNKIAQDTGEDSVKIADTLQSSVTVLQSMGYSYSDAATLIGNLGKEGIDASAVMTGLNKAFIEGSKEGKSAQDVISDLTTTMTTAKTDSDAYAEAIDLFGKKAGPQLAGALQDGRLSLDALGTSLEDNVGNVSATFEETLDPIDNMQTAMNELKIVGADVGSTLMTMAVPAIQKIGEFVSDLKEKWDGLSPSMQEAIIKIALIAAVVGPVVTIVGTLISSIGSIISAGGALIGILGGTEAAAGGAAAGAGLLSGGLLPIIGIIAAVVAAGALIIANWDTIKATATALKDNVVAGWGKLKQSTSEAMENVKTTATNAWNATKTNVETAFQNIKTSVSDGWANAKEVTEGKLKDIKDSVSDMFKGLVESALKWGKDMIDNFRSGIEEKWEDLKDKISDIGQGVKDFLGFSVPKTGPLADADTWMPDMMQLLSQGIKDNAYLVRQATEEAARSMYVPNALYASETQADTARELGRLNDAMATGATNVTVVLSGDAGKMLKVLSVENNRRTRATGYNALSGVMA